MAEKFNLITSFRPTGDQPSAIQKLTDDILLRNNKHNLLLGVTGSGKTFVMANVIAKVSKPTLVISPNKILAAQLYAEFKKFFPENAVEYFISYYDYYQPEAYIPQTDTFIEKDAAINEHIDRLRLKATSSLMSRSDVIVVASVSCIYNLGSPEVYKKSGISIKVGEKLLRSDFLSSLVSAHYQRNDFELSKRGYFRVKGSIVDIFPAYLDRIIRVEFSYEAGGDNVEKIYEIDPLTSERVSDYLEKIYIYPAKHFVADEERMETALNAIKEEMEERVRYFESCGKLLEAQRLKSRTEYDIEMMRETGFCHGVENYSRHLSFRPPGSRPECLIDYFPDEFLVIIDESHLAIPQLRGMYEGDRARKETLVEFGFRLPSALDNRPLKFTEFEKLITFEKSGGNIIYASATPGEYELEKVKSHGWAEIIIRPTGLVDPYVEVRPSENQVKDVVEEIKKILTSSSKNKKAQPSRIIVNTLTKRTAEDFALYLAEEGINARYLHSTIPALERIAIIKDFRLGKFDVLVGVNLLREGLDLPEVVLVAVFDADKEGYLRSERTLIQISGRAARNVEGRIILYASKITTSMRNALGEMSRRRKKQIEYNEKHHITPRSIIKAVDELSEFERIAKEESISYVIGESRAGYLPDGVKVQDYILMLEDEMKRAADALDFETAAALRDKIFELKNMMAGGGNVLPVRKGKSKDRNSLPDKKMLKSKVWKKKN